MAEHTKDAMQRPFHNNSTMFGLQNVPQAMSIPMIGMSSDAYMQSYALRVCGA